MFECLSFERFYVLCFLEVKTRGLPDDVAEPIRVIEIQGARFFLCLRLLYGLNIKIREMCIKVNAEAETNIEGSKHARCCLNIHLTGNEPFETTVFLNLLDSLLRRTSLL